MTILSSGPAPAAPGTYLLLLALPWALNLTVGRLGRVDLPAGWYVYVGSALGPGGLAGRLQRHMAGPRRYHWHIDYLAALNPPWTARFAISGQRQECRWVQTLHAAGASWPVRGFGSSDCRAGCAAHLLRLPHDLAQETPIRSGAGEVLAWTENIIEELA